MLRLMQRARGASLASPLCHRPLAYAKSTSGTSGSSTGPVVDLRSDTLTLPTAQMRARMAAAPVGDDVYGEDPTVNTLETIAAQTLGKEAAVFVPSGTMGNLLAVASHLRRGEEVVLGHASHILNYEAGGASVLLGVPFHTVQNQPDGTLRLEDVAAAIRPEDQHCSPTRLVAIEQTHNMCGGRVLPMAYVEQLSQLCRRHSIALHMDGARVCNAAVALGLTMAQVAAPVDTLTLCLSKGLGAPVGSVLAGPEPFVRRARRLRKMVGGGMRQAGVLAAAGLEALEHHVDRLATDHANARYLAAELASIPGVSVDPATRVPESNIVFFTLDQMPSAAVVAALATHNVRVGLGRIGNLRALTHLDLSRAQIDQAIDAIRSVAASARP